MEILDLVDNNIVVAEINALRLCIFRNEPGEALELVKQLKLGNDVLNDTSIQNVFWGAVLDVFRGHESEEYIKALAKLMKVLDIPQKEVDREYVSVLVRKGNHDMMATNVFWLLVEYLKPSKSVFETTEVLTSINAQIKMSNLKRKSLLTIVKYVDLPKEMAEGVFEKAMSLWLCDETTENEFRTIINRSWLPKMFIYDLMAREYLELYRLGYWDKAAKLFMAFGNDFNDLLDQDKIWSARSEGFCKKLELEKLSIMRDLAVEYQIKKLSPVFDVCEKIRYFFRRGELGKGLLLCRLCGVPRAKATMLAIECSYEAIKYNPLGANKLFAWYDLDRESMMPTIEDIFLYLLDRGELNKALFVARKFSISNARFVSGEVVLRAKEAYINNVVKSTKLALRYKKYIAFIESHTNDPDTTCFCDYQE